MPAYVQVVVGCQPFARGAKRDAYMVWEVDRNGSVGDRVLVGKFPRVMSPLGTPTGLAGFAGSSVAVGRGGATPSRRSSMSQCVMQSLCDARAHLSARTSHTHLRAVTLTLTLTQDRRNDGVYLADNAHGQETHAGVYAACVSESLSFCGRLFGR